MDFINVIFWIVFLQYIWFNTDAFIWWSKLFKLEKLLRIGDWDQYRMEVNPKIKYYEFIFQKYPNFLTKLISCRPCLNLWITLIFILLFNQDLESLPIFYLISYLVYKKFFDKDGI